MKHVLRWRRFGGNTRRQWRRASRSLTVFAVRLGPQCLGWCLFTGGRRNDNTLLRQPIQVRIVRCVQVFGPGQGHVIGKGPSTEKTTVWTVPRTGIQQLKDGTRFDTYKLREEAVYESYKISKTNDMSTIHHVPQVLPALVCDLRLAPRTLTPPRPSMI